MNVELSNEMLKQMVPSVFAKAPWEGVSDRYAFIPSIGVIDAIRDVGYVPVRASQSKCRTAGKREFTKHLIRFRSRADCAKYPKVVDGNAHHFYKKAPDLVEIALTNAHDLSSAYCLDAGVFRMLCSNGLMIRSANFGSIHIRHSGDVVEDVLRGTEHIIKRAPLIREQVAAWQAIQLSPVQQQTLAEAALIQRYGMDPAGNLLSPVLPAALLVPRRPEDKGNSLWLTTNVIQENMMRGELTGTAATGRRVRTRAITSVNAELAINRGIWAMAEVLAEQLQ